MSHIGVARDAWDCLDAAQISCASTRAALSKGQHSDAGHALQSSPAMSSRRPRARNRERLTHSELNSGQAAWNPQPAWDPRNLPHAIRDETLLCVSLSKVCRAFVIADARRRAAEAHVSAGPRPNPNRRTGRDAPGSYRAPIVGHGQGGEPDEPTQTIEPASRSQTNLRQAASDLARRFPPMTTEQAAAVHRALQKQRR